MTVSKLNAEGEFVVKESKTINFVIAGVMLAVYIASMLVGVGSYLIGACIFLLPAAYAIVKGRRNATIMRINKTGFYYAGRHVTDWNRFYDAAVRDKMKVGSYYDNFVLDLRYYSADYTLLYTESIPLTNTQDKAEEEIIEAIIFYKDACKALV